ncbi:MAG: GntR family transcriptional regulator [Blautia sp.]|nr:GntR family transcriptional regulator [Blautia sp.]
MKYDNAIPIYLQVIRVIERDIVTGRLAPGDKLPSARDLALVHGINPNTAARVYRELEQSGVCFTRRGLGTFVTEDEGRIRALHEEMADDIVSRFVSEIMEIGMTREETISLLEKRIESCSKAEN